MPGGVGGDRSGILTAPIPIMCAWHGAQAAVPGEAWDIMVRRYRTEGRRNSLGNYRIDPCIFRPKMNTHSGST